MTLHAAGDLIGKRYYLHEQLGAGSMGVVYRATDRLTQSTIALKLVTTPQNTQTISPEATLNELWDLRLMLAREFQTLGTLHHPHVISVLDYGFDEGCAYFTMDFLPEAKTVVQAAQSQTLLPRVDILIQSLQALAYLHRRGILHRDIKPANMLVVQDQVKLLDFGLSVAREQARGTAGTIAYMAPEVLRGTPADETADLYAIGVIAYELFAERHPYPVEDTNRLIINVLSNEPNMDLLSTKTNILVDDLIEYDPAISIPFTAGSELVRMVQKLLHKNPESRYQNANDVIADLCAAVGQPIPQETTAIRESFLQAARFVGRDAELAQLMTALSDAMDGRGSAWLVAGESGVGKSRLLDELRVQAMVRGGLVLSGQMISTGGFPYHLWRTPLRRLLLATDVEDGDASILKEVIPDVDTLLGRSIPDAPKLDGRAAQQRLAEAIVNVFQDQPLPVVLLVEDLHWARESLLVLRELIRVAPNFPMLIIGTYRDDERPDIPGELPLTTVIRLERFSIENIQELSVSMLGESGREPRIVDFLQRESEGNVFFMIETVRALAEEAGRLSEISHISLPDRMFPKGVQAIVQRRLDRIPFDYHPLLRLAAVAGRQLDLNIIRRIDPVIDLNVWLLVCAEAGLLELEDGQWRFAHDKLRDGILNGLAPDQLPKLHRMVAEATEAVHPGDMSYAYELVDHWHIAHEVDKEIIYTRLAVNQRLASSDYQAALSLLQQVMAVVSDQPLEPRVAELRVLLAETLYSIGSYEEAQVLLEELLPLARQIQDQRDVAAAARLLGNIHMAQGKYEEARQLMQESLTIAQASGDQPSIAQALRTLGVIAENLGDLSAAIHFYQQSLDLFKSLNDQLGSAGALANLASIAFTQGLYAEAQQLNEQALAQFTQVGFRWGVAYTLIRLGEVAFNAHEYELSKQRLDDAIVICREIGHRWGTAFALTYLGRTYHATGQIDLAELCFRSALQIAHELKVWPLALEALFEVALLLIANQQWTRAAWVLGGIKEHPAMELETRRRLDTVLTTLEAAPDPLSVKANLAAGRALSLEVLIEQVLALPHWYMLPRSNI